MVTQGSSAEPVAYYIKEKCGEEPQVKAKRYPVVFQNNQQKAYFSCELLELAIKELLDHPDLAHERLQIMAAIEYHTCSYNYKTLFKVDDKDEHGNDKVPFREEYNHAARADGSNKG